MILKMCGIGCILAASIIGGYGMEMRLKERAAILQEMQELLVFLEKEMTCRRSPIPEAFHTAAGRSRTVLKNVLTDAACQAQKRGGGSFEKIWAEAVEAHLARRGLERGDIEQIRETAGALCGTDLVLQKTMLDSAINRFRDLSTEAAKSCQEKALLYRKLAAAAGVFLIILLL